MMYMSKRKPGRPKKTKQPKKQTIADFRDDIKIFKNSLQDALEEEEYQEYREPIEQFLKLPVDEQNLFIIYLLKDVTITELSKILDCDRLDLYRIITKTKRTLKQ